MKVFSLDWLGDIYLKYGEEIDGWVFGVAGYLDNRI